jgi:CheY-like chemotaxis protein
VQKTLLAVDDSTTMRKVLEITFMGDEFRVVSADGSQGALARMSEGPVAAIIDASLEGDGYALAKEMRARDPRLAIVLLASRYNPYDANRGREAGADDYADKPFDTQALIDKVKKAIVARETAKPAAAQAPVASAPPQPTPAAAARPPGAGVPLERPVFPTQRARTLSFEGPSPAPPPAAPPAVARPPAGTPVLQPQQTRTAAIPTAPAPAQHGASEYSVRTAVPPRPTETAAPTAASASSTAATAASGNGQLASKLGEIGLTPMQIDAVLALSREVVERVVWEVVPQLAETLIKEELARLTKDG